MALHYKCPICHRALGYEVLCWECKAAVFPYKMEAPTGSITVNVAIIAITALLLIIVTLPKLIVFDDFVRVKCTE